MSIRLCLIAGLVLAPSVCGAVPVTIITNKGHALQGTLTISIPTTFAVSNNRLSCFGAFPPTIPGAGPSGGSVTYALPMRCNHGVKGIAIFYDAASGAGGGTLRLSDGTEGTFVYGAGAEAF